MPAIMLLSLQVPKAAGSEIQLEGFHPSHRFACPGKVDDSAVRFSWSYAREPAEHLIIKRKRAGRPEKDDAIEVGLVEAGSEASDIENGLD